MELVYVPVITATGNWTGKGRGVDLDYALVVIQLDWRSLGYLLLQTEMCRECLRRGLGDEQAVRILGEKAADYARQLLDERYGKTRTNKEIA